MTLNTSRPGVISSATTRISFCVRRNSRSPSLMRRASGVSTISS
jgi:hypothetical protein